MRRELVVGILLVITTACGQNKGKHMQLGNQFIDRQLKIIDDHAKELKEAGRMPSDFAMPYMVLGQYGWHSADESESEVGPRPSLWLLQQGSGRGGSFGAYSFYRPAFEQAKRSWWINGVMQAGSDLLYPMNRGARFDRSIIGYKVGYIYEGPGNATVIDVPTYSDGSLMNVLRLDKKSENFVRQFDLSILPSNYVDMCQCTMSAAR